MRWVIASSWPWPSVQEIERRFDELIRGRWGAAAAPPAVDVYLEQETVWVEVDLPGVEERDVRLRAEGGVLWIEAVRRPRAPSGAARVARVERPHGPLRRGVPLPPGVRPEPVEVRLEAGVLRVRLGVEKAE